MSTPENQSVRIVDANFLGSDLSANIAETPEGFLVCQGVKFARLGVQKYQGEELGIEEWRGRTVKCYRLEEDVFTPETLASFEGKPFVDDHPSVDVVPENYGALAKGHMQNVRREGEYLVADIVITDPITIDKVKSGRKRQVSAGYQFNYAKYKDGIRAKNIRGNHVALVKEGRAGPVVAIKDSISQPIHRSNIPMNKRLKALATVIAAAKDATPEQIYEILEANDSMGADAESERQNLLGMLFGAKKSLDKKMKDDDKEDDDEKEKSVEKADDSLRKVASRIEDAVNKLITSLDKRGKDSEEEEEERQEKKDAKDEEEKEEKKAEDSESDEDEDEKEEKKDGKDSVSVPKSVLAALPQKYQQMIKDSTRGKSSKSNIANIKRITQSSSNASSGNRVSDAVNKDPAGLGKAIMAAKNPHYQNQDKTPESPYWG